MPYNLGYTLWIYSINFKSIRLLLFLLNFFLHPSSAVSHENWVYFRYKIIHNYYKYWPNKLILLMQLRIYLMNTQYKLEGHTFVTFFYMIFFTSHIGHFSEKWRPSWILAPRTFLLDLRQFFLSFLSKIGINP